MMDHSSDDDCARCAGDWTYLGEVLRALWNGWSGVVDGFDDYCFLDAACSCCSLPGLSEEMKDRDGIT